MHYKLRIAIAILVVNGDDLKNIVIIIIIKQFPEKSHCKTPWVRKLGHTSAMQRDALVHRVGLKD